VKRRLGVDDQLAVGQRRFRQAAGTVAVDVDHVLVEPAIDLVFDRGKRGRGALVVFIGEESVMQCSWSSVHFAACRTAPRRV
jgi:hypothetical protein